MSGKRYEIEEGRMTVPGWLDVARVGISQIKKSLKLSKGFGTHPRTHRKPLKSFKQGRLHLSEFLALRNRD